MAIGPQSNLSAPAGYSSSDLVFNDSFSGTSLDSNWNSYITSNAANGYPWNSNGSGGSTEGGPYNANYDMPSQISVNYGLTLTAIQQSIQGVNQGGVSQTFPVTSGAVSSYGHFEFDGGYLQISMQQPSGNGAWPALWMLPGQGAGSSGDNFEIDMQEGGFTNGSNPNENVAWHLHTSAGNFGGVTTVGTDLSSGFHTYGIDWEPGKSITWYLDGKEVGQVTSAQAPIPNEPMEVIMGNAVANSNAAGWHTTLDSTTPYSMPMQIGDVQLYQHAGSGATVMGANVTASSGTSTGGTTSSGGTTSGGTTSGGSTSGTDSASGSGTTTTTPTPIAPELSVADNSLYVSPGGSISLGIGVSVPHAGDNVTVNISGMRKYETITDNLDHKTFGGRSVNLTAAEVNSGLSLNSSYHGHGSPKSQLTVTATDNTGTPISSASQTVTVVDPPATTVSGSGAVYGSDLAQWFDHHPDFAPVATTLSEAGARRPGTAPAIPTAASPTESAGAKAFALFNQMMAGDFGGVSHFAQAVAAPSSTTAPQLPNFLTRPLH